MEKKPNMSEISIVSIDIGGTLAKLGFTLPFSSPDKLIGYEGEKQPEALSKRIK